MTRRKFIGIISALVIGCEKVTMIEGTPEHRDIYGDWKFIDGDTLEEWTFYEDDTFFKKRQIGTDILDSSVSLWRGQFKIMLEGLETITHWYQPPMGQARPMFERRIYKFSYDVYNDRLIINNKLFKRN